MNRARRRMPGREDLAGFKPGAGKRSIPRDKPRPSPTRRALVITVAALAVALFVAAVVSEVGYTILLKDKLAATARAENPGALQVQATVGFPVSLDLLTGRALSSVAVSARNVSLGPITADQVVVRARGVSVDPSSVRHGKTAVVTHIDHLDLTAVIGQVQASVLLPPGSTFVFSDDSAAVEGQGTQVLGTFKLRAPAEAVFSPLASQPSLASLPVIAFPVTPLSVCISGIGLGPGTLTVSCSLDNPPIALLPHP